MLTCIDCFASTTYTQYLLRLQYGLKPNCKDYIGLIKLAQILYFLKLIESEDCAKDLKCFLEKLNCN